MSCLVVSNSLVKYWGDHMSNEAKVICLPGAKLLEITRTACEKIKVGPFYKYMYMLFQSGILDLHENGISKTSSDRLRLFCDT